MDLLASVANKRLTAWLSPLDATLTKSIGGPCFVPWVAPLRATQKRFLRRAEMHFDTVISNHDIFTWQVRAAALKVALLLTVFVLSGVTSFAQQPTQTSEPPEMLVTEQGFLAIDTPKGWVRADGPGLAYFVTQAERNGKPSVWIYISSAPVGPNEESKDVKAYIESDVAGFKERFKNGVVQEETPLDLPHTKLRAPVYTFQSGEKRNSVEQVVYVAEINRVLTLVLSAREKPAFTKALPAFQEFVRSYRGSITPTSNPK